MSKANSRYLVGGGLALTGAMGTSFIECSTNNYVCKSLDGFFLFLIVLGGVVMGATLSQVWAERGKKKDEA